MKWDREDIGEHFHNIATILSAVVFSIQLGWDLALFYWTMMAMVFWVFVLASRR